MKKDWTYKKLGEVAEIYQPKTLATSELIADGKYLVYGANGVIGRYNEYNHKEKEILVTCRGATCGTINISEPYSWINGNAMVVHIIDDTLSFDFLKYSLNHLDWTNIITGAAQPQITRQNLSPAIIPIPPLSIQRSIVSELDLLHSVIEKKQEQLRALDNLAQSLFYQMFGDPITNPMGWQVKKLGDVAENCDYMRKPITASDRIPGNIPYYGASGIVDYVRDYIFDGDYLLVSEDGANLLARSTPIAFSISGKNWVNNHAHVLKFQESYTQLYVQTLINLIDISDIVTGAVQPKLNQAQLNKFSLPLPPLSLQQSFAAKVSAIEAQKQAITQSIKDVESLLAQRMDHYFG